MISEQKVCQWNLICIKTCLFTGCEPRLRQLLKYYERALCLLKHCLRIQSKASAKSYLIQEDVGLFILFYSFSVLQLNERTDV